MTHPRFRDPDDAGHWEGDKYVFTPPLQQRDDEGNLHTIQILDFALLQMVDGITRHDVVHAILNATSVQTLPDDE